MTARTDATATCAVASRTGRIALEALGLGSVALCPRTAVATDATEVSAVAHPVLTVVIHLITIVVIRTIVLRSHTGRAVDTVVFVVTTVPTVAHTSVMVACNVRTVVVAMAGIVSVIVVVMPTVSSAIGGIEVRPTEVEVVTTRIAGVDAEMPVACVPV